MPPVKEYKIESISEAAPTVLDIKQTAELKKVRAQFGQVSVTQQSCNASAAPAVS